MFRAELRVLTVLGTPESVAQLGVEEKPPVSQPGPAVVSEAVSADEVVAAEHQDRLFRDVTAGEAGHLVDVPPDSLQGGDGVTSTGRPVSLTPTPEVEGDLTDLLAALAVSLDLPGHHHILKAARFRVEEDDSVTTVSAPHPQLGRGETVLLLTPTIEQSQPLSARLNLCGLW